ncbi:hypothetical protein TUM4445_40870 [Shewanella sp. MBTL60-112-B2]|nr:hypothetical protein TUM4444_13710 [Shewanella sp. MBTL60-112-B1]GIU40866.1 hypothetical protein TUM4445_40870 [Shewanella sp. MBTL60-112-B2]
MGVKREEGFYLNTSFRPFTKIVRGGENIAKPKVDRCLVCCNCCLTLQIDEIMVILVIQHE